jgi:hypothetical protein
MLVGWIAFRADPMRLVRAAGHFANDGAKLFAELVLDQALRQHHSRQQVRHHFEVVDEAGARADDALTSLSHF